MAAAVFDCRARWVVRLAGGGELHNLLERDCSFAPLVRLCIDDDRDDAVHDGDELVAVVDGDQLLASELLASASTIDPGQVVFRWIETGQPQQRPRSLVVVPTG